MQEIEKIYDGFYKIDVKNHSKIVKFYENNQLILDNKSKFIDFEDFKEHTLILAQYIISLESLGKLSKTIKYAEKTLSIIETNIDNFETPIKDFDAYWSTLTSKGRAHYNIKEYKVAIEIFEKLIDWDNENDYFKQWLDASKKRKRNSLNKYFYLAAFIFIFGEIAISRNILNQEIKLMMLKLGFLCLLTALINEYFWDKIIKWIKK
jgi:tetratricopeptide (TPR) repeat protein